MEDITQEQWICALDSVTWYNGLAETVLTWLNLKPQEISGHILPEKFYGMSGDDKRLYLYLQLQVLWMIAVELFGDYGTSPRSGWITDIDGFKKWVLDITQTYRDAEESEE